MNEKSKIDTVITQVVHVVFYKKFGQWHCTVPFLTKNEANTHAMLYLFSKDKDYDIKDVTFKEIELP